MVPNMFVLIAALEVCNGQVCSGVTDICKPIVYKPCGDLCGSSSTTGNAGANGSTTKPEDTDADNAASTALAVKPTGLLWGIVAMLAMCKHRPLGSLMSMSLMFGEVDAQ